MNGKSGLFPSNFVKELDGTGEDGESNDNTTEETGRSQNRKQAGLAQERRVWLDIIQKQKSGAGR